MNPQSSSQNWNNRMSAEPAVGIYEQLGVRRVINARSYSTKLGGCAALPEVLEAMHQAGQSCVRMEDLQQGASRIIAEVTGAEAGIVTSGASAALSLAAAACLAGLDVGRMNQLPDTSGLKNEVVVHRSHRNDYDHALRLAGARFVEAGFSYYTFPYEVEQAISERTVALFFLAGADEGVLPLHQFVAIAHRHGLPVIVDASAELPPAHNLRAFVEAGVDLVAFSGGKHIRGPQATGILCGRKDLILSAALQHQDMDVFPETWPHRHLIQEGSLAGPPHHGIGRGFKVGKEEIVGLITALRLYGNRDFASELGQWMRDMETVASGANGIPGLSAKVVFPQASGRPVPNVHIVVDPDKVGMDACGIINKLQEGNPPICVFEKLAVTNTIVIMPEALQPGDASTISYRLNELVAG
jgi:D-glucosaminate-6-phosphate ammonia-lyase